MSEGTVSAAPRGPRVFRNDWGVLSPPPLEHWRPSRTVSVIVPAYNCQSKLNLALAGLSRQTYPHHLMEVVVVDDGSEPKLELPEVTPPNCRLLRVSDHSSEWGRANALNIGVEHSDGEILHWLDADIIPFPEHVAAQARWHHVAPDVVTLGYKRFVQQGSTTPEEILARCAAGTLDTLFPPEVTAPHDYVEGLIEATDQLRQADPLMFRAHVGATSSLRRELCRAAGGLDPGLKLGEDTELGHRLVQQGAVFVPEPQAQSWHMGPSHMMTLGAQLRRHNQPFLAERMAQARWLRRTPGRIWAVPLVVAVVEAAGQPLELVRACVDRLLASDEADLRVRLVGDWGRLSQERRPILADPDLDLRLIAESYRADPRVELVTEAPVTVFPSPFLLKVPPQLGVGRATVSRLLAEADQSQAGLLRLLAPGAGSGLTPPALELWRTAAVSRAMRHRRPGETLTEVVSEVYGSWWLTGDGVGVVDLPALLSEPPPQPVPPPRSPTPDGAVPVAGLRSLIRATGHVARLAARRALRRARVR